MPNAKRQVPNAKQQVPNAKYQQVTWLTDLRAASRGGSGGRIVKTSSGLALQWMMGTSWKCSWRYATMLTCSISKLESSPPAFEPASCGYLRVNSDGKNAHST